MSVEKVFVEEIRVKDNVESTFIVKHIALMEARDGSKYLNVVLGDKSGTMDCRIWGDAERVAQQIEKGNFVVARGRMNLYQNNKQFVIQSMDKVEPHRLNMEDYVVKSAFDADSMYSELIEIVEKLDDVYIRDLLKMILDDVEISRRLKLWSAGKTIHHAYQSGLLEHILSCSRLAQTLSTHYQANVNYVVAGCVLHDLCKIYELSDGTNVEYTEEGKLVGHLVKGLEIVDRFSYRMKFFPHDLKMHLKHILLSHHGEYQHGSPKLPQTSEAMLVHLIDMMDSRMHAFETIKQSDSSPGHWSGFVKHLDRIVYKHKLPHYTQYIDQVTEAHEEKKPQERKIDKPAKPAAPKDLKQNLGKLLQGFKDEE